MTKQQVAGSVDLGRQCLRPTLVGMDRGDQAAMGGADHVRIGIGRDAQQGAGLGNILRRQGLDRKSVV